MAVSLLSSHEISDLCIGKPPLRCLPSTATVGEAFSFLRRSGETYTSVWICDQHPRSSSGPAVTATASERSRCVGQVSVIDVVCFLCRKENLSQPLIALESPVSVLLPKAPELVNVKVLEPSSSLLEAIECICEGAQNLIIPTNTRKTLNQKNKNEQEQPSFSHNGRVYCWITQDDIVRFLLNSINLFSPFPTYSIESLNLIQENVVTLHYDAPALPNLPSIQSALATQMAVAVLDDEGRLMGEISAYALAYCDETVVAAAATLSVGDLMAYVDCAGPPKDLIQLVKSSLMDKNLAGFLELMDDDFSADSSSSDEEFSAKGKSRGSSGRRRVRTEAIVCHPKSSMLAVMIQALTHRVNYAWVVEANYSLVGMVTFAGMLNVFRAGVSRKLNGTGLDLVGLGVSSGE